MSKPRLYTEDELRNILLAQFIRDNVVITSRYMYEMEPDDSQVVELWIKGDEKPFSTTEIYFPDRDR